MIYMGSLESKKEEKELFMRQRRTHLVSGVLSKLLKGTIIDNSMMHSSKHESIIILLYSLSCKTVNT